MNLKDLSKTLGLSQTTVSRALNGYPEVSEKTRKRVHDAAAQFNYRPNLRATSLATGRTMCIGHVIPFSTKHEMVNIIFSDFIAGAGEIYAQHGYDMRVSMVSDEDEESAYVRLAVNGAVDGVILHGPTPDDPRIPMLTELGLPFVVHGRSTNAKIPYTYLDVDNTRAIMRATQLLLDLNHKRIGLINGLESLDFAVRRRSGYLLALTKSGIEMDSQLMRSSSMTEPNGYRAAVQMLSLERPATAFVVASIVVALGVRRAIEERGLTIGKDVSLICYDDEISYLPNDAGDPIFTAARSSVRSAGRRCAELLVRQISGVAKGPEHELWEAELVLGRSTGPCPGG